MHIKSNADYWNELLGTGALFSYVKDGPPKTFLESMLGFAYPLFLVLLIGAGILFMLRLDQRQRKWKTYLFSLSCGTILGGAWCCMMQKADPLFPGWLFAPWSVTGIDFGLTLEDWLFLPSSTTLFYIVYRNISIKRPIMATHSVRGFAVPLFYGTLSLLTMLFAESAGRTEIIMFIMPSMALYIYGQKSIDLKKFIFLQAFVILFEVAWDLFAVSLVHGLPGFSWAAQWTYLSFDVSGNYFHSKIFLQYGTHRWAWILMNPLEITPLFGICGGLLNYTMFSAGDTFFYRDRTAATARTI